MTEPSFERCCCDWLHSARVGEDEENGMILHDDLRGVDELIAEIALTRRVRQRYLVEALRAPARPLTALVRVGGADGVSCTRASQLSSTRRGSSWSRPAGASYC